MIFLNIVNQFDENKKPWITIDKKDNQVMTLECSDQLWDAIIKSKKTLNARKLEEVLTKQGFEINHDPTVTPNGITCSSAGILVCLNSLTQQQKTNLKQALENLVGKLSDVQ